LGAANVHRTRVRYTGWGKNYGKKFKTLSYTRNMQEQVEELSKNKRGEKNELLASQAQYMLFAGSPLLTDLRKKTEKVREAVLTDLSREPELDKTSELRMRAANVAPK